MELVVANSGGIAGHVVIVFCDRAVIGGVSEAFISFRATSASWRLVGGMSRNRPRCASLRDR